MKAIAGMTAVGFFVLFVGGVLMSVLEDSGLSEAMIIWAVALIPLYVVVVAVMTIMPPSERPR